MNKNIKTKKLMLKKRYHQKQNYYKHYTQKNIKNVQQNNHKGGSSTENFEITTLDNIDINKFSISQYINANVNWGIMPGPPPTDCNIM